MVGNFIQARRKNLNALPLRNYVSQWVVQSSTSISGRDQR